MGGTVGGVVGVGAGEGGTGVGSVSKRIIIEKR
jgi:hypothetical protein